MDAPARTTEGGLIMALDSGYFEVSKPATTNADRIRAMSDEELAEWVTCPRYFGIEMVCDTSCVACCLEWLKQPSEEDAE